MAQRRPGRKRRAIRHKPGKYHPLNRAVKKRNSIRWVKRQKAKEGRKEWKNVLLIIFGFLLAAAILILLYYCQNNENKK